jgi:UDP-N-acetylglucosamine acyltransferase
MIHPKCHHRAGAQLGANVAVGAYSIIGEHVEIGDNT